MAGCHLPFQPGDALEPATTPEHHRGAESGSHAGLCFARTLKQNLASVS